MEAYRHEWKIVDSNKGLIGNKDMFFVQSYELFLFVKKKTHFFSE